MGFNTTSSVLPASRSIVVTGGVELDLASDPEHASTGFMPNDDGPFICRLFNDTANRTFQVVGGGVYPLAIAYVPSGNARSGVLLFHR